MVEVDLCLRARFSEDVRYLVSTDLVVEKESERG
jgi:hypothetical protein